MPDDSTLPIDERPDSLPTARLRQADHGSLAGHVLEDPAVRPSPGVSFGPFRILRELGRGGMGVVYLAEQPEPRREVALKVLAPRIASSATALARFHREVRVVGGFQHDHIVRILTAGEVEGAPYYAMEYVEGRTLSAAIAGGPLEPRRAARLAAEVARGLAHAHKRGVIHRDVKPANVLLRTGPEGRERALLADFGLVRDLDEPGLTEAEGFLGTPAYMAPEQILDGTADTRSDLYALGATLYEMLTGVRPLEVSGIREILCAIADHDPVPPRRRRPEVPRDLENVCLKLLSRDPERRYQTADEAAADLDRFLAGEAVRATRPTALYRASKFVRRHRAACAVATVAVLALVGLSVRSYLRVDERRRAAERERTRAERLLDETRRLLAEHLVALGRLEYDRGEYASARDAFRDAIGAGAILDRPARWRAWDSYRRAPDGAVLVDPGDAVPDSIALSADGETLAIGTTEGYVLLHRGRAGGEPAVHLEIDPLRSTILALAFADGDRLLAAVLGRGDVRFVRLEGAPEVMTRAIVPFPAADLLPGPGSALAVIGRPTAGRRTIRAIDATTGARLGELEAPEGTAAAFGPGGELRLGEAEGGIVVDGMPPLRVCRIDPARPHVRPVLAWASPAHRSGWALSGDGRRLATIEPDGRVRIVPAGGGAAERLLVATWAVRRVAFDPDRGALVASGDGGRLAWDPEDGSRLDDAGTALPEEPPVLPIARHRIASWSASLDGRSILVLDTAQRLLAFDCTTGRQEDWPRRLDPVLPSIVGAFAFAPDGRSIAVAGPGELVVLDVETGRLEVALRELPAPGSALDALPVPTAVAFRSDGRYLAVAVERTVRLYDLSVAGSASPASPSAP